MKLKIKLRIFQFTINLSLLFLEIDAINTLSGQLSVRMLRFVSAKLKKYTALEKWNKHGYGVLW